MPPSTGHRNGWPKAAWRPRAPPRTRRAKCLPTSRRRSTATQHIRLRAQFIVGHRQVFCSSALVCWTLERRLPTNRSLALPNSLRATAPNIEILARARRLNGSYLKSSRRLSDKGATVPVNEPVLYRMSRLYAERLSVLCARLRIRGRATLPLDRSLPSWSVYPIMASSSSRVR